MDGDRVLSETQPIAQVRYHAALLAGLESAERHLGGRRQLQAAMGISRPAMVAIMDGTSAPHEKRLWDLLTEAPNVLDEVARLYGMQVVPAGALCVSAGRAAPAMVAALHKIVEAEADGTINHQELLDMEREIVAADQAIKAILARIAELRRPRGVA